MFLKLNPSKFDLIYFIKSSQLIEFLSNNEYKRYTNVLLRLAVHWPVKDFFWFCRIASQLAGAKLRVSEVDCRLVIRNNSFKQHFYNNI